MTFTPDEFRARLRAHLPTGWFPDDAPVLDGILSGMGAQKSFSTQQLDYVGDQMRIATLRDVFLDIFSEEFFGADVLPRKSGELDDSFRARIKRELFRDRGTRPAMIKAIMDLTGNEPVIFEPMNIKDTGAYNINMAYGSAGRYGSSLMSHQVLMDVKRGSTTGGIPGVQGYGNKPVQAYAKALGGYGVGAIIYATQEMIKADVTDQDIMDAVNATRPASVTVWTRIT